MTLPQPTSRYSETALEILRARYFQRAESGALIESLDGMFERGARAVAAPARLFGEDADYWQAHFLERMQRLEFLPNSPTFIAARTHYNRHSSPVWRHGSSLV